MRTIGTISHLDGGNAETGNGMGVPEADASSEEDRLVGRELLDDVGDVCLGETRHGGV